MHAIQSHFSVAKENLGLNPGPLQVSELSKMLLRPPDSGYKQVNGPLARATAAAGNPGPSFMLLVSQESEISALRIFLNSDFTGTLEQLAGKTQSSAPRGFLTLDYS